MAITSITGFGCVVETTCEGPHRGVDNGHPPIDCVPVGVDMPVILHVTVMVTCKTGERDSTTGGC